MSAKANRPSRLTVAELLALGRELLSTYERLAAEPHEVEKARFVHTAQRLQGVSYFLFNHARNS